MLGRVGEMTVMGAFIFSHFLLLVQGVNAENAVSRVVRVAKGR